MFRYLLLAITTLLGITLRAQGVLDQPVEIKKVIPLSSLIDSVEHRHPGVSFFYLDEWINGILVTPQYSGSPLGTLLSEVLTNTNVNVLFLYDYAIILVKDPKNALARDSVVANARKKNISVERLKFGSRDSATAKSVKVNGRITDQKTNVGLADAVVDISGVDKTVRTSLNGVFQFEIPPGEYVIYCRVLNYEDQIIHADIFEDATINVALEEMPLMLQEVIISDESINESNVGQTSVKLTDLKRTPSLLGQADVIRNLQLQTGVTSVSEVSPGFNVRGGGADQNLVLLDGVPIFNTSHALGFFSAFNAEAVKDISFYKGGIPAEFGGRASSVLNILSREGNYNKWQGNIGASLVAADVALDGPIIKDRSALSLSLRSTYSDWILNFLENAYQDVQNSSVAFFDGSVKYTERLRNGGKITVSGYFSRDRFRLATDSVNQWQNITSAVRYDDTWGERLTYSLSANLGQYSFELSTDDPATAFRLRYKILYPSLKFDVNREGRFSQAFGIHLTHYNFSPGELKPTSPESNSRSIEMQAEKSVESALYFSNKFLVGAKMTAEVGARLSVFNRLGPGVIYQYAQDSPLLPRNITDSVTIAVGRNMKTYWGFEPRAGVKYQVSPRSTIKLGYNRMFQYVHLVSNTATITPVDIWQSSNQYFKPQKADQISLGYFTSGKNGRWQTFVEAFYKSVDNVLDFKDGPTLILNRQLETALLPGTGRSYGLEVGVVKSKGKMEFELNHTFSRSLRLVNGYYATDKVNEGEWYAANYDQPHITNLNWRYGLGKKVFFTGTFSFRTGRPISVPEIAYEIDKVPVIGFSERNNYRLPNYHRLDLALVVEGSNKKDKRVRGQWSLSVYNVYGRKNPYAAFFSYNIAGAVKPNQISLIGIPVPSFTYRLKF